MFPTQFDYHRPSSVGEAVRHLQENPDAKILAGGHSLLPAMKLRLAAPAALIDLNQIDELRGVHVNGGVRIGAMTTYQQLLDATDLKERFPIIHEAAYQLGDPQVHARGTVGGSLAHADPSADLTAVVLALNASITVVGASGERTIPVDDLFVDLFTTALAPDEVMTEIAIPAVAGRTGMSYQKHRHPASGYAVVGVAAVLEMGEGDTCQSARIAITGATSKPTRASGAEAALSGQTLSDETIASAASVVAEGLELNGDLYASEEYRRHLISVYARRAIEGAWQQIRG